MIKNKKTLIDAIYLEADKLAKSMSSRSHLLTDAGRRLCQYIVADAAKRLSEAIINETEETLDYEKDPRD